MADGPASFARGSSCPALLWMPDPLDRFAYGAVTRLAAPFHALFCSPSSSLFRSEPRRRRNANGLGSPLFDRLYWGVHCCFLFLRLLRCFSSPGSPRLSGNAVACIGLPHSDIPGSKVICTSPELFAACHVFLRLLKPRHPPSALVHFLCLMSFIVGRHTAASCVRALTHTAW